LNYYLIYISQTKADWDQKQLIQLLQSSWNKNKENNVSGMLVYLGDKFIQLLEGAEEKVVETYERIVQDDRHSNIRKLLEGYSDKRIFKDWSMGFKMIDEIEFHQMAGFRDPLQFFSGDNINNLSHPALIFLKLFYDKNYRDFQQIMS
jgi:hypothetical protein